MNYDSKVITRGEKDAALVIIIQNELNNHSPSQILVDGQFDKETLHSIKAYQSKNCDYNFEPLLVNGEVDEKTWNSLMQGVPGIQSWEELTRVVYPVPFELSPMTKKVLEIAQAEVGVHESSRGTCKGDRIRQYLLSLGLTEGKEWDAAFVYFCFALAAQSFYKVNPLPRNPSPWKHYQKTKGLIIPHEDAIKNMALVRPGDIFVISCRDTKGHTGIVTEVHDGYIRTIEGNVNDGRSNDGYGVHHMRRKIETINPGFIRY